MLHRRLSRGWLTFAIICALQPRIWAQAQPAAAQPAPHVVPGAADLAKGWAALSAGRATEAIASADAVLRTQPRSIDALSLKIHAAVTLRRPTAALDAYEAWLTRVGNREDMFLLEPIAIGVLEAGSRSAEPDVKARALELLARTGDSNARAQLAALASGSASPQSLSALARTGDPDAVKRLAARVQAGGTRDVSLEIDALREGGVKSASTIVAAALDPSRPLPTKMAAARALGQFGDPSVIPKLAAALQDPDPPVRLLAAASLARLGDPRGGDIVRTFANSPLGDLRLLAVEADAPGQPTGSWTSVANEVLKDPDPLVRLRAAELLLQHAADPSAAQEVMRQALTDTNPAMRDAAAQRLAHVPAEALGQDVATLRKLLRDSSALVQVEAAGSILRLSGAAP
jgi:HEAT repeat protein